jgi:ubiquinone/menaquinone biosynthesis C-methylase UbiE
MASYIAKLEGPDREAWQKPAEVIKAAGVSPGQTVCDIGAGTGYFALRMAQAVGERGTVFAVDVELKLLSVLLERIEKAGVKNVTPVFALPADPLLPSRACDLIFVIDTYHHFPDGPAYLKRLARSLKPGGKLVNVDFHARELPVGPKHNKISREDFLAQAKTAGLALKAEHTFLPYQYFLVLEPSAAK